MRFSVEISETRAVPKSSNTGSSSSCGSGFVSTLTQISNVKHLIFLNGVDVHILSLLNFVLLFEQLNFFRKGLKSLEAVEQHLRVVAERQHIDYQFSGLEDDDVEDGEDDGENGYDASEGGELSFDYRQNKRGIEVVSATTNSMEVRN